MDVKQEWLEHGLFQVTDSSGKSFNRQVPKALAARLGLAPADLQLASFPVGPAWRFALWWREWEVDFAEAQFMAAIAADFPILSLGVSVEKGLEKRPGLAPDDPRHMDRRSWDWPNFRRRTRQILMRDIPRCSQALGRPVSLRLIVIPWEKRPARVRETHTFACDGNAWFRRRKGQAQINDIRDLITNLDGGKDHWVNAHIVCDLADARGLTAEGAAGILHAFAQIRDRIRR